MRRVIEQQETGNEPEMGRLRPLPRSYRRLLSCSLGSENIPMIGHYLRECAACDFILMGTADHGNYAAIWKSVVSGHIALSLLAVAFT